MKSGSFILVEGADGTGKTTLADQLALAFGAEYEHVGPPRHDMTPFAEHTGYAFVLVEEYGRVVFDRFHLGTFAYGPIFRPENDVDGIGDFRREDWDLFEHLIAPRCLLVLCDPGWDEIEKNLKGRDGTEPYPMYEDDPAQVLAVHRRFQKAYEFSKLRKTRYDYTQEGAWGALLQEVEGVLEWQPLATALPKT